MLNGGNGNGVAGAAECTRLEVLNISNKNARGETVLNDEHLLELMQRYPFLYDPQVRPNQDADYDEWAWEHITAAFNRSYSEMPNSVHRRFSVAELQQRWQILTPIIKSLSKAYDLNSIPESLRQIVVTMSTALDTRRDQQPAAPTFNRTQQAVLENVAWVEQLPLADRRRLEAEIMELLLAAELSAKGTARGRRLDEATELLIDQEYEDFLKAIRLKELFVLSNNDVAAIEDGGGGAQPHSTTTSVSPFVCDLDAAGGGGEMSSSSSPLPTLLSEEEEHLLKPLPMPTLHYHQVQPCVVRLKRLNLEEYMPLAQIARIKRERVGL